MVFIKKCCFCFTPRTGSVILGCIGVFASILFMVPHIIILNNTDYFIGEYIKDQRAVGANDIADEEIPAFSLFIETAMSIIVTVHVTFTFASILLIAGVAAEKHFLLVPWLVVSSCLLLIFLIFILAVMISFGNNVSFVVLGVTAPFLVLGSYFWFNVYTTYHQIRKCTRASDVSTSLDSRNLLSASSSASSGPDKCPSSGGVKALKVEEEPASRTTVTSCSGEHHRLVTSPVSVATVAGSSSASASLSSLESVKLSLKRAVGVTPPPPYEAVALDIDREEAALAQGIVDQKDLIYTSNGPAACVPSQKAILQQQLAALRKASCGSNASTSHLNPNSKPESSEEALSSVSQGSPSEDLQCLDSIFVCTEDTSSEVSSLKKSNSNSSSSLLSRSASERLPRKTRTDFGKDKSD